MENNLAISVKNISKIFKIPHERVTSLRGAAVSAFRKKNYEEFKALDQVSFEVKKGEFFGIIGRNGSGKSTLLKILAGIYQPNSGKIEINGRISPFLELGIGFNPELSGRDNVYLNATVLGLTKKEIDQKFASIVAFSELERFIDQKLKNYSSGMQVRLAFSVSIHANRDILLMDEVLAVGDSNFQSKCLEEFSKYKELGRTVIIVTHDIAVVQRYCDRAMLMRNGKIAKIGQAEEVADAYIYENMDDEERRMIDEEKEKLKLAEKELEKLKGKELEVEKKRIEDEKKKQEEERKNKVAEITGVEFLDKDGKKKNVFETGEAANVRIYFKINQSIPFINFGFGIHSEFSGQIFGYNTQTDRYSTKKTSQFITLSFDSLPILKGVYFINVSCFRYVGEPCYDFKPKYKTIKFFTAKEKHGYAGLIDLKHSWKND